MKEKELLEKRDRARQANWSATQKAAALSRENRLLRELETAVRHEWAMLGRVTSAFAEVLNKLDTLRAERVGHARPYKR